MSNYPTREGVAAAEPLEFDRPRISISCTVAYRGRQLVISAEGLDADRFCDLLDKRFGQAGAQPEEKHAAPLSSPPLCPIHRKAMKPMKFVGKRGEQWMCTFRFDDGSYCDERSA